MKSIRLPGPGARVTTQLGFGCAYLVPENARLLEAAYDAGIRHFDVGRSYGRGLTESIVGRFARHHSDITLTSKYGIRPPFSHPIQGALRRVLRPVVKMLRRAPAINRNLDQTVGISNHKASFTPDEAVDSLRVSLRNLRVDRLDLFLMHEAGAEDLRHEGLLQVLKDAVQRGTIGAFGVGGDAERVPALLASRRDYCGVLQHQWSPLAPLTVPASTFSVLYRVFNAEARKVAELLAREPAFARRCNEAADSDLRTPGTLQRMFLSATLSLRPDALVLFSSGHEEHIAQNVRAASDPECAAAGRRILGLLREAEGATPRARHG